MPLPNHVNRPKSKKERSEEKETFTNWEWVPLMPSGNKITATEKDLLEDFVDQTSSTETELLNDMTVSAQDLITWLKGFTHGFDIGHDSDRVRDDSEASRKFTAAY